MNYIKFNFTASEYNGWPKLKFFIDQDLYHDYEFSESTASVELPLDLIDGPHEICIELYNKKDNNTLVIDDKIVKDQLVTLNQIYIDNVQLPDFVKYLGVYRVGTNSFEQALTWGVNGTWTLPIEYPIIDWVLFLKLEYSSQYVNRDQWATSVYHPKKIELLKDKLKTLNNLLGDAKNT